MFDTVAIRRGDDSWLVGAAARCEYNKNDRKKDRIRSHSWCPALGFTLAMRHGMNHLRGIAHGAV
jgi:hypothetical protein